VKCVRRDDPEEAPTVRAPKNARVIASAAVVLQLLAVAPLPVRATTPSEVRSLRGLQGVEVVVENPDDDARMLGLSSEQLQGDAVARLRDSGVRVLTADDRAPGRPWLYLRVFVLRSANLPIVSYYVTAQLRQDATLDRNPDLRLGATTWDVAVGGLAGTSAFAGAVRETVRTAADRFAADFLTVNGGR